VPTPEPSPTIDPNVIARFENPNAPAIPPEPTPTPVPTPTPTPAPVAPEVDLVVPEQLGSVVTPVRAARGARGLAVDVVYPAAPGLYRLVATLHTPEGVAYDSATQALLVPVLVRVGGSMAAAYGAPSTLALPVGSTTDIAVRVLNAGAQRWDREVPTARRAPDPDGTPRTITESPFLVATWVSADGRPVPASLTVRLGGGVSAPGGYADVLLHLAAPAEPGTYLVLVDVLLPGGGPMSAMGSAPAIIRVTVNAVATATPAPTALPSPSVVSPSPTVASPSPAVVGPAGLD
jgi:hypothetical protein